MKKTHIEWNKVTWYSTLCAVILFVVTFFLGIWLGEMYMSAQRSPSGIPSRSVPPVINDVTFECPSGQSIHAQFRTGTVELELSDGRHLLLQQTISADGARYADHNESLVFWNKGNGAFIEEGTSTDYKQTYQNCVTPGPQQE